MEPGAGLLGASFVPLLLAHRLFRGVQPASDEDALGIVPEAARSAEWPDGCGLPGGAASATLGADGKAAAVEAEAVPPALGCDINEVMEELTESPAGDELFRGGVPWGGSWA